MLSDPRMTNLSGAFRRAFTARKLVDCGPGGRAEKISAVRNRIEQGTYRIDYERTARRVLQAMMDDRMVSAAEPVLFPVVEALSLS